MQITSFIRACAVAAIAAVITQAAFGQAAPGISTQPASQTAFANSNAIFSVTASGQTPLTFQWSKDGVNLANGANIVGATNSSLTIVSAGASDIGSYGVVVTNRHGSVTSANASLTVLLPPSITQQPQSQSVVVSNSTSFFGTVTGTLPITYQWYRDATQLSDDAQTTGTQSATLSLAGVTTNNAGSYALIASNAYGTATSAAATLTLLFPPVISAPGSGTIGVGSNVQMTATIYGTIPLTNQWFHNGAPIVTNSRVFTLNPQSPSVSYSALSIGGLQPSDAGTYTCICSNVAGTATCNSTLDVAYPAAITTPPASQTVIIGSNVTFSVVASGTSPTYQWKFNGTSISGATDSVLTINDAQAFDQGQYQVVVANYYGSATASPVLTVVANPVTLLNLDLTLDWFYHQFPTHGPAAIGQTPNDFWNIYTVESGFNSSPGADVVWNIPVLADGSRVNTVLEVINGTGAAINQSPSLAYNSYVYSTNDSPVQVRVFNLPRGTYDFYVYGHEPSDMASTTFQLSIAGITTYTATNQGPGWNSLPLHEGVHYVAFRNVFVPSSATAVDIFSPSNSTSRGIIAAVQIAQFSLVPVAPEIWTDPAGSPGDVPVGSTVNIPMRVTGTQPITYQWWKDGVALIDDGRISGSTTTNLTVPNVQTNDNGIYWLVASNAVGVVSNASAAIINVRIPPSVIQPPTDRTNAVGTVATFTAIASGDQPLTYEWEYISNNTITKLVDNARISGSATSSLTISNVQPSDAGVYSFSAQNSVGAATALANLSVVLPPTIATQPIGRSIPLGLPTAFVSTLGTGTPPFAFQWQLNGTNIPGATRNSYFITNVSASDLGTYNFVASNLAGITVSSNALLTIGPVAPWGDNSYNQGLPPPGLSNVVAVATSGASSYALRSDGTLAKWGQNAIVPPNFTNIVAVSVTAGDGGIALRADGTVVGINRSYSTGWTNIISVAAGPNYNYAVRSDGTVLSSAPPIPPGLTHITAISAGASQVLALRDDGTVVAWDGGGNLLATPSTLSNVVSIACGYNYALAVRADGRVIAWGSTSATNVPAAATNAVAVSATVSPVNVPLSAVVRADGAVVAWGSTFGNTNPIAPLSISNAVAVAVGNNNGVALVNDGSPQLLRVPVGGTIFSGNDFTLKVTAAGAPQLSYQWSFNGVPIQDATNAALTITNIQSANAGTYQVVVTNALGSVSSVPVPINVNDRAPFFSIQPANRTTYLGSAIHIGVPANGSGPMTYIWHWFNNGPSFPDIVTTNSDLFLNPARISDTGTYSIIASNNFGTTSSSTFSLVVRQVAAWGDNTYNKTNVPIRLTNAIAICGGDYNNSMALCADGTVMLWGSSNGGGVSPAALSNVTEIASSTGSGGSSYLALRQDGSAANFTSTSVTPVPFISNAVAIESDTVTQHFLLTNGNLVTVSLVGGPPLHVVASNVVAVSPFDDGCIALRADGTLLYSGSGTPPDVKTATTNIQTITAARYQGTFLKRDRTVRSWGTVFNAPTGSNFIAVATTAQTSAAVDANGNISAWSYPAGGPPSVPATIPVGLTKVWAIDGGYNGFIALCSTNTFPPLPLSDSLDTAQLVVSSRNSAQWFGQTNITHDGISAAQSAQIDRNTASSMRMLATNGPTTVSFWWKVSSETNHDFLTFSVGGVQQAAISGEVGWQQVTFFVPSGPQMLVWTYAKDSSGTSGRDAGFVDQLVVGPQAPFIYGQPQSQTVLGGTPVNFSVQVVGQQPFIYRWYFNENRFGPGLPTLPLGPVNRAMSGTYKVVIENHLGVAASSNAFLTVHTPQQIAIPVLQPDGSFLITSQDDDNTSFSSQSSVGGFQAQYSSNLIDWYSVNAPLSVSNGLLQFSDIDATNATQRFYRIIEGW